MPVTRYYGIATSTSRGANEPSTEQSAALPFGSVPNLGPSGAYVDGPDFFELGTAKTVAAVQNRVRFLSLGQVSRQSTFMAHGWYRLGAQTIPAGTWGLGTAVLTSDPLANTFFAISIYVWRPSTSSVVGYVYDATTELGTEWRGDFTAESRLISLSGNSVTAANGDTLIFEIWATAAQGGTGSYTNWIFFDQSTSAADFSANGQTGLSSWIDAPDTLVPFDSNQPIGPGSTPNTIGINQTGLGSSFTISQQQIGVAVRGTQ
jgi:hypothetical protein